MSRYQYRQECCCRGKNELTRRPRSTRPRHLALKDKIGGRLAELQELDELLFDELEDDSFRSWFDGSGSHSVFFSEAVTVGSGPLNKADLDNLLRRHTCEPCVLGSDLEVLVVGWGDWDEATLRQQVALRTGKHLKVYSQEMVFAFLACGRDPFENISILHFFGADHPALQFLMHDGFDWPTTQVKLGYGEFGEVDSPGTGMLSYMGYHVGKNGLPTEARRKILAALLAAPRLPNLENTAYVLEWGDPNSPNRLRKMADSLATFARNAKRRNNAEMIDAITDWEIDLNWLKATYYAARYTFVWPSTFVGGKGRM